MVCTPEKHDKIEASRECSRVVSDVQQPKNAHWEILKEALSKLSGGKTANISKHRTHCKHIGDAHFDRLLGVTVAPGMLDCIGIFLWDAVDIKLFSAQPHDTDECLYFEVEARKADHASCKTGNMGALHQST